MEKRNFVTSVLADNMLAKARMKNGCVLEMSTVRPEDLRGIELVLSDLKRFLAPCMKNTVLKLE